jgi:ketosteroid isomerase-like protein
VSTQDRFAIMDLMARYSHAVSDRRYEDFGALYTEDGGLVDDRGFRAVGPAAMAQYVREAQRSWGAFLQINVNISLDVDGDTATGSSDYVILRMDEGQLRLFTGGRYEDEFRRTPDGWKFAARRITPIGSR